MTFGLLFWILMLLWVAFDIWSFWPDRQAVGRTLFLFVLFLILGWATFGPPIR